MDQPDPLPPPDAPRPTRRWPALLLVLLVLAAAGGAVWSVVVVRPRVPVEPPPAAATLSPPVDGGPALSVEEGDALVRRLAAGWSTDPLYARWLEQLVLRQVVAAAQLVAEGSSPRPVLPFLSLGGPFVAREQEAPAALTRKKRGAAPPPRVFIAPESYARYDELTRAFGSVDAAAAGEAWSRLRPFCDVAFAEIGRPGQRFDDVLAAAIRRLVSVRLLEGEVELVPAGAVYAFKDPSLEALTAAEKHLLRLGPKNGRVVQAQLRAFASHAGLDLDPDAGR